MRNVNATCDDKDKELDDNATNTSRLFAHKCLHFKNFVKYQTDHDVFAAVILIVAVLPQPY